MAQISDYELLIPSLLTSPISSNISIVRTELYSNYSLVKQILELERRCVLNKMWKGTKSVGGFYIPWTCSYSYVTLIDPDLEFIWENFIQKKQNNLGRLFILAKEVNYNKMKEMEYEKPFSYTFFTADLSAVIDV